MSWGLRSGRWIGCGGRWRRARGHSSGSSKARRAVSWPCLLDLTALTSTIFRFKSIAVAGVDYDPQQRRLLTESYMARRATVELEGLDTTISLTEMKHRVAGMPQAYNVRGRMAAQGEPLAPLPMAGGGGGVGAEGSMEARALAAGTLQRFEILPRREWVEGSDEDHHFRIAEAQFLRTGGGHRVQLVCPN